MTTSALRSAVTAAPGRVLLAVDFDGTLAPIVDDPAAARALPEAVDALAELAPRLAGVGIVTGRPPLQAIEFGDLAGRRGLERLVVLGHYGDERWDAATGEVTHAPVHLGLAPARAELPSLLARSGASDARIEDKGASFAVHTRGLEPEVFDRLVTPLTGLAAEHGLHIEPGRQVIELRPPGSDKRVAMEKLIAEFDPAVVVFIGDDLGDLPAFNAVVAFRQAGGTGFCVASSSDEQPAIAAVADLVVEGPPGVAQLLRELADAP